MADFDAFESAPQDDPAADFLAREQDELKGLDDDNFGTILKALWSQHMLFSCSVGRFTLITPTFSNKLISNYFTSEFYPEKTLCI